MTWVFRKKVKPVSDVSSDIEALKAQERALKARDAAERNLQEMRVHAARSKHQRSTNHFAPAILEAFSSRRNND